MSELCNEKDGHTSSDDSTPPTSTSQCPRTPSPKRKKKSATFYRHHKHGRQLKKNKGKRKRVSSSSSASSSVSCASTDSDSHDLEIIGKTMKKIPKKSKRHWHGKYSTSTPKENRMCGIFQAHYSTLVTRISSCLLTVANELFSKKMISNEVQSQILANQGTEQEKTSKLLFHVKKMIDDTPSKLTDFIEVLQGERTCDDIVAKMTSE